MLIHIIYLILGLGHSKFQGEFLSPSFILFYSFPRWVSMFDYYDYRLKNVK